MSNDDEKPEETQSLLDAATDLARDILSNMVSISKGYNAEIEQTVDEKTGDRVDKATRLGHHFEAITKDGVRQTKQGWGRYGYTLEYGVNSSRDKQGYSSLQHNLGRDGHGNDDTTQNLGRTPASDALAYGGGGAPPSTISQEQANQMSGPEFGFEVAPDGNNGGGGNTAASDAESYGGGEYGGGDGGGAAASRSCWTWAGTVWSLWRWRIRRPSTTSTATATGSVWRGRRRMMGSWPMNKDSDGVISAHDELSFVSYVEGAQTDLKSLAHFDTNGNGQLDPGDAEWSKFRVWQDVDQDGESDPSYCWCWTGGKKEQQRLPYDFGQ